MQQRRASNNAAGPAQTASRSDAIKRPAAPAPADFAAAWHGTLHEALCADAGAQGCGGQHELTAVCSDAVCRLHFAGQTFVLDVSGAAYWAERRTVLVADLHLEKGSAFAKRGMFLPPYDSTATVQRLAAVVARYAPAHVIALGDSFHDANGAERLDPAVRDLLERLQTGRRWTWLTGNHDPHADVAITRDNETAGPNFIDILPEATFSGVALRHEPVGCHGAAAPQIAGHLHPVARIAARRGGARRRCFIADNKTLILPAFGAFTGGLNVLDPVFSELFPQLTSAFVAAIGQSEVYPIPTGRLATDRK